MTLVPGDMFLWAVDNPQRECFIIVLTICDGVVTWCSHANFGNVRLAIFEDWIEDDHKIKVPANK